MKLKLSTKYLKSSHVTNMLKDKLADMKKSSTAKEGVDLASIAKKLTEKKFGTKEA